MLGIGYILDDEQPKCTKLKAPYNRFKAIAGLICFTITGAGQIYAVISAETKSSFLGTFIILSSNWTLSACILMGIAGIIGIFYFGIKAIDYS